jgi:CDGSH-type Zn-finger protein
MDADAVIALAKDLAKDPTVLWSLIVLLLAVLFSRGSPAPATTTVRVNTKIKKTEAKVVDFVECGEIENLGKDGKLVMCRCWKSESFPYCDGSHVAHNKETGDNVGPLIIKK